MLTPQDLQRLIDIITEEVIAAQAPGTPRSSKCACHSLLFECCPDRLRGVLDAGATRLGMHATGGAPGSVSVMIDHTLRSGRTVRSNGHVVIYGDVNPGAGDGFE